MVKERQPFRARREGKVHGQLGRAMAPCQLARVLLQRVLRVVDHEVSAGKELHVPLVLAVNREELSRVGHLGLMARVRLVIGSVDHRHATGFQAVTKRKPGVVLVTGSDLNGAEVKGAFDKVMVANRGAELAKCHREIRVLHLPGEGILQALPQTLRRVDVPFVPLDEERREKGKTLDVVPVRVSEQEMTAHGALARRYEASAQIMSTGAAVEDNQRPVCGAHLHTGGVAPVANRARPRLCQGASRPPKPNTHRYSFLSQLLEFRFCLFEPEAHLHLPHHCDRSSEMLFSLLSAPYPPVQFTQTNVAMRDERTHAELFSEGESLAIVGFCPPDIKGIFARRDLAKEQKSVRFVSSLFVPTGETPGALCGDTGIRFPPGQQIPFAQPDGPQRL